jgi:16S rRNA (uracil1498-N3)-methyltransferase
MHRFLSNTPLHEKIILTNATQLHQIMHVFRAKIGDRVIFFESGGSDIIYEITQIGKKEIVIVKKEEIKNTKKDTKKITLFQALPNKISTIEVIVQKWVEMGVWEIVFFSSDHSQIKDVPPMKRTRISSIAQEALEQSGGNIVPSIIYEKGSMADIFKRNLQLYHIVWTPSGEYEISLKDTQLNYALWIGPEGWWSSWEELFFRDNNYYSWSFNPQVLRLETASIVGLGILTYLIRT